MWSLVWRNKVEDAIANTEKEKDPDYKMSKKEEENQELYTENQALKQECHKENFILPIKNEEKQPKIEEKVAGDDIEEEEGSGRFVEIDNEEFEVIDDMDEDTDSGDDDNREVKAGVEAETGQGIEHVTPEQPDPSAKVKYQRTLNRHSKVSQASVTQLKIVKFPRGCQCLQPIINIAS